MLPASAASYMVQQNGKLRVQHLQQADPTVGCSIHSSAQFCYAGFLTCICLAMLAMHQEAVAAQVTFAAGQPDPLQPQSDLLCSRSVILHAWREDRVLRDRPHHTADSFIQASNGSEPHRASYTSTHESGSCRQLSCFLPGQPSGRTLPSLLPEACRWMQSRHLQASDGPCQHRVLVQAACLQGLALWRPAWCPPRHSCSCSTPVHIS